MDFGVVRQVMCSVKHRGPFTLPVLHQRTMYSPFVIRETLRFHKKKHRIQIRVHATHSFVSQVMPLQTNNRK